MTRRPHRIIIASLLAAACLGAGGGAVAFALHDNGTKTIVKQVTVHEAQPIASSSAPLSVNQIYRKAFRGVVEITVTSNSGQQSTPFGGGGSGQTEAEGSGWVYDSQGHIVTNEHVVDGATSISVQFWNGKTYTGHLVGTDKTTDWKAVLTKIRGQKPDAVFYGGMDATGGPLIKQGRELGIKAVFAFGDGACTEEMNKLGGPAAEGLLCSQAGIPPQAASKKFLDAYKKKFNVDPIIYSPFTYDAANMLIAAMKKSDSSDPKKYLPELQKMTYNGATGPISFDDKGDRKDAEITIFTMKGKLEPIAVVKGGKAVSYDDFLRSAGGAAPAAAPAEKK